MALLAACASATVRVAILDAYALPGDREILLYLNSCNSDSLSAEIVETAEAVTVVVTATNPSGDDCSEPFEVDLAAALGDRTLIDGSTESLVDVEPPEVGP